MQPATHIPDNQLARSTATSPNRDGSPALSRPTSALSSQQDASSVTSLTSEERTFIGKDLFNKLKELDPDADADDYCHDKQWDIQGIGDDIRIIEEELAYNPDILKQKKGAEQPTLLTRPRGKQHPMNTLPSVGSNAHSSPKRRSRRVPASPPTGRSPQPTGHSRGYMFNHINPASPLAALVDDSAGVLFPRAARVPCDPKKKHSNMVFSTEHLENALKKLSEEKSHGPSAQEKLQDILDKVKGSRQENENQLNKMYVRVLSQEKHPKLKSKEKPFLYPVEGIIASDSSGKLSASARAPGDIITLANGWHCHMHSYEKKWRYAEHTEVASDKFQLWQPPNKDLMCEAIMVHGAGVKGANGLYRYTPARKMGGNLYVGKSGAGIVFVYKTSGWYIREIMRNSASARGVEMEDYPLQPSLRHGDAITSINGRTIKGINMDQQVETMKANMSDGARIVLQRPSCWTHVSGKYRIVRCVMDQRQQAGRNVEWSLQELGELESGASAVKPLYSSVWTQRYGRNQASGKTNPPFREWEITKREREALTDRGVPNPPVLTRYEQPRTVEDAISVLCSCFPHGIREDGLQEAWREYYGRSIAEMYLPHLADKPEQVEFLLQDYIRHACRPGLGFKKCARVSWGPDGAPVQPGKGGTAVWLCLHSQVIKSTEMPSDETFKSLSDACRIYITSVQASAGVRVARIKIIKLVDNAVRTLFPNAYLELHGSVQMQIDVKTSDLDITVRFRQKPGILDNECKRRGVSAPRVLLEKLAAKALRRLKHYFASMTEIFSTRIPIINIKTNPATTGEKVELDIKVSHHGDADMLKTLLMCRYIMIGKELKHEPRVRELIMIVKHWAKKRAIQDASKGLLNSFSYCLLVIQFLQLVQPPVLPTLMVPDADSICKDPYANDQTSWPAWFHDHAKYRDFSAQNTMSLGELWYRFIRYYAHANFSYTCFSVRHGKPQFKPNCPLDARYKYLAIMDPIDPRDSCSRNVCENITSLIRNEFQSALKHFQDEARGPGVTEDTNAKHKAARKSNSYRLFKKLCSSRLHSRNKNGGGNGGGGGSKKKKNRRR